MRAPSLIYNTEFLELQKNRVRTTPGWPPARGLPRNNGSRWYLAWKVLIGDYDALEWRT
jgi:hypothetical protein